MATYDPGMAPVFPVFPVTLVTNGDPGNEDTWNNIYRSIYDGLQRVKLDTDDDIGVMAALQTKLGLPVAGPGDLALPTYASSVYLIGALSYQTALETLDTNLGAQTTRIDNVNANVGGSVATPASPTYASTNVIVNGQSHHESLENLDAQVGTNSTLIATASSDAAAAAAGVTNIAAKLGVGAELAPAFDWIYELLISDGQTIKTIVDNFDRYIWANQRLADQAFGNMVKVWKRAISADFTFYDTFINLLKVDGASTATPDVFLYEVTGSGLEVIWVQTLPATHSEVAMLWDYTGTVTFSANLIGSLAAPDFDTIPTEDTFVALSTAGAGTSLVVKAVITGAASKLYNVAVASKV